MYPARGVVLTYLGGEQQWCPGTPRALSLEIVCAALLPSVAAYSSASVREENTCSYRVQLPSIAGCPLECRAVTDSVLCSGHGVCGYNVDAVASQCYCHAGWSGSLCSAAAASSGGLGLEGIMLIVVCLILVGVLGIVGFMIIKLRKINVNPAAYAELQGKCEYKYRQLWAAAGRQTSLSSFRILGEIPSRVDARMCIGAAFPLPVASDT